MHKTLAETEPDSNETDRSLNPALTKVLVEPWQNKWTTTSQDELTTTVAEPKAQPSEDGPMVTLTATVVERFVNTLISQDGEPDYVPLTTNFGLKYKRRMLYFPMDFGELTLDGLVDTGALSSAIPEADLRKI